VADPSSLEPLLKRLLDPDRAVRDAAAASLLRLNDKLSLPTAIKARILTAPEVKRLRAGFQG
jgi:HEAT repeat protein